MKIPNNLEKYRYISSKIIIRFPEKPRYKINNKIYTFQEKCTNCGKSFLSVRPEANTCCRTCRCTGKNNGRYNDHRTWKDLYGKDQATKLKEDKAKCWMGENNPNFGNNHWYNKLSNDEKLIIDKKHSKPQSTKGKTFDEIYGVEKSKKIKKLISINTKKHMPEMEPPPISSSYGYSGKYKGYFFRSLLELSYIVYLIDNNISFKSAETKNFSVKYTTNEGVERNYYPDFYLTETHEIVEVKPKFKISHVINERLKIEAGKNKYGDKYIVITEDDILKLSGSKIISHKHLNNIEGLTISKQSRRRINK